MLYTSRVPVRVDHLPDNIASALYRLCQEAATNGARHGCGGRMHIRLVLVPSENAADLTMEIEAQAGEITIEPDHPGPGLIHTHHRADAIGAASTIDPPNGPPPPPRHPQGAL